MLKFPIFLFIPFIFGLQTPNFEEKPIIVHFEQILNEYRVSNGLNPVKIDYSIKEYYQEIAKILNYNFSHNGFTENIHSYISGFTYGGENIAKISIPKKDDLENWLSNMKEIQEIFNKMSSGTTTDYDIAKYCFLVWKRSESHNEQLLDEKIKRFYLSYQKIENDYYFCFIALN